MSRNAVEFLRHYVMHVTARTLWIRGRETFLNSAFALTAAAAIVFLTLQILQVPWVAPGTVPLIFAGALGLSLILGIAACFLSRLPLPRVILNIDRAHRMEGRLYTACEAIVQNKSGGLTDLLIEDAAQKIMTLDVARAMPLPPVGYRWGIVLALCTAFLPFMFPASPSVSAAAESSPTQHIPPAPVAEFTPEPDKGHAPLKVSFRNSSRHAERFAWDFGDGATSMEIQPVHIYSAPGTYTATLHTSSEQSGGRARAAHAIKILAAGMPMADFTAHPVQGAPPLQVQFEDRSTGKNLTYAWDFGDPFTLPGRANEQPNPVHTYKYPGTYTVKLIVQNSAGEDERVRERYIRVGDESSGGSSGQAVARKEPMPRAGTPPQTPVAGDKEGKLFGPKTERPKIDPIPEGVKPIEQNGPLVDKERPVFTPKEGRPGASENTPYSQAFPHYRKMAEDTIRRETIPPGARDFLRKYFEAIRPK